MSLSKKVKQEFPTRVIEREYPNGDKYYIGQVKVKTFFGLCERWKSIGGEQFTEDMARMKAYSEASDRYFKKHKKDKVL